MSDYEKASDEDKKKYFGARFHPEPPKRREESEKVFPPIKWTTKEELKRNEENEQFRLEVESIIKRTKEEIKDLSLGDDVRKIADLYHEVMGVVIKYKPNE